MAALGQLFSSATNRCQVKPRSGKAQAAEDQLSLLFFQWYVHKYVSLTLLTENFIVFESFPFLLEPSR
jgi:hypothetical protein